MAFDSQPPSEWNLLKLSRLVVDADVDNLGTLVAIHNLSFVDKKNIKYYDLAAYNRVVLARAHHIALHNEAVKAKLKEIYALYTDRPLDLLATEDLDLRLTRSEFPQIILSTPERSIHLARIRGDLYLESYTLLENPTEALHSLYTTCAPIRHALLYAPRDIAETLYIPAGFVREDRTADLVAAAPHLQGWVGLCAVLEHFRKRQSPLQRLKNLIKM